MVSLLAGTITSPERRFPPHKRHKSADEEAKKEMNDRKAVIAVANSLLSIGGAGIAAWWASGIVGWRDEWVGTYYLATTFQSV
jgi:TMEM199 family protein